MEWRSECLVHINRRKNEAYKTTDRYTDRIHLIINMLLSKLFVKTTDQTTLVINISQHNMFNFDHTTFSG